MSITFNQMIPTPFPMNAVFYGNPGHFPPELYRMPIVCLAIVEDSDEEEPSSIDAMVIMPDGFVTFAVYLDNFIGIEVNEQKDWSNEVRSYLIKTGVVK